MAPLSRRAAHFPAGMLQGRVLFQVSGSSPISRGYQEVRGNNEELPWPVLLLGGLHWRGRRAGMSAGCRLSVTVPRGMASASRACRAVRGCS